MLTKKNKVCVEKEEKIKDFLQIEKACGGGSLTLNPNKVTYLRKVIVTNQEILYKESKSIGSMSTAYKLVIGQDSGLESHNIYFVSESLLSYTFSNLSNMLEDKFVRFTDNFIVNPSKVVWIHRQSVVTDVDTLEYLKKYHNDGSRYGVDILINSQLEEFFFKNLQDRDEAYASFVRHFPVY